MANWYGSARSNYFKVKDRTAFEQALTGVDVQVYPGEKANAERICLLVENDDGAWPSTVYDERTEDWEELDLAGLIAEHLEPGEVCILQEVGAEKLRYLTGWSVAITSEGELATVSIDNIYDKVRELRPDATVTEATY